MESIIVSVIVRGGGGTARVAQKQQHHQTPHQGNKTGEKRRVEPVVFSGDGVIRKSGGGAADFWENPERGWENSRKTTQCSAQKKQCAWADGHGTIEGEVGPV